MDETKSISSGILHTPALPSMGFRRRTAQDVPEDVDFLMDHLNDPNFDLDKNSIYSKGDEGSFELEHKKGTSDFDTESHFSTSRYSSAGAPSIDTSAATPDDDSPYPEVRAAVNSFDDPSLPVNTFRMWFLGLFYTIVVSGLNQLFSMRYPSVTITGIVAQLTALPLGRAMQYWLPTRTFRIFGRTCSLNPGPFNVKEHVCITVMANVVVGGAYCTDVIATQRVLYGQIFPFSYQILLVLSTQLMGFTFGGYLRKFVVWPASMIWPGALVNAALFNALHKTASLTGPLKERNGRMTRNKFFCIAMVSSFAWYFIPGYLFTALSTFNWICWIAPNNIVVNALFGASTGLGMSVLTFDWSMIAYIGSPLVTPWWSIQNTFVSLVIHFWWITPAIYFTNTWFSKYMPISGFLSFDRFGAEYDTTAIMTDSGAFDLEKYQNYSPLFMTATLAVGYATSFASLTAVVVHTFLWYRSDIVRRISGSLKSERDVHARLMQAYAEVPWFWYAGIGAVSGIFLLIAVEVYDTQLPIWAALIAVVIAACLSLPVSMLQAITNQGVALQVFHELLCGYMLPGRPVANMIFKGIAYIGTNQAVSFSGDLKLGHYLKVPPRTMFNVQVVAVVVSCFVVTLVQNWMFDNIPDLCSSDNAQGFVCPGTNSFGTASIIWGAIGPARIFGKGSLYNPLMWFFAIGAILPVPFYFLARKYPRSIWRYVNIPIFFAGVGAIPPATGLNYASWALVGFIFNYWIRRYNFRWWMRYNYILSAALDAGVAIAVIIIFFCLQYPFTHGETDLVWWGNTVPYATADGNAMPAISLGEGETFGPAVW